MDKNKDCMLLIEAGRLLSRFLILYTHDEALVYACDETRFSIKSVEHTQVWYTPVSSLNRAVPNEFLVSI